MCIRDRYSDGSLFILNSNFQKKFEIYFKDLFPVSLGGLNLDATYTDTEYFAIDATFKYSMFDIKEVGETTFFKQSSLIAPTVTLNSGVSTDSDGVSTLSLTYTSTNAISLVINQGIGAVAIEGIGITKPTSDVSHLSYNGVISFTITATSADGLVATATTTLTLPTQQTSTNRTCIAVCDESGYQTLAGMEVKWNNFRTAWPDRVFYLLSPSKNGSGYSAPTASPIRYLNVPPSFLEEVDPNTANSTAS